MSHILNDLSISINVTPQRLHTILKKKELNKISLLNSLAEALNISVLDIVEIVED